MILSNESADVAGYDEDYEKLLDLPSKEKEPVQKLIMNFCFFKMITVMEEFLEDYNQVNTAQMKLVLFLDAVQHVCRISRIIRQPLGNALLLGVGGSGRQSLSRLATHM